MTYIINLPYFPSMYINNVGLTQIKIYSEFLIMFLFISISIKIFLIKSDFNNLVYNFLTISYAKAIAIIAAFGIGIYDIYSWMQKDIADAYDYYHYTVSGTGSGRYF